MKAKEVISERGLRIFESIFKPFIKAVTESSDDYAFYRGELFSDDNGTIHTNWYVSDIDGAYKVKGFIYNDETGDIFYDKGFVLKNDELVARELHTLLLNIERLGKPISKIHFEVFRSFISGKMFLDPNEAGCYEVYLISLAPNGIDMPSFCMTGGVKGHKSLTCDWNSLREENHG